MVQEIKLSVLEQLRTERVMSYQGGLFRQTQVDFAFNSNHMEGSTLTKDETRLIYDTGSFIANGNSKINVNDVVEAVNHFRAFNYLLDVADEIISEDHMKEFHKILKSGTLDADKPYFVVGDYKKLENTVGNIETTSPDKVPAAMEKLLKSYLYVKSEYPRMDDMAKLADIIDFHVKFEKIHPFQDGNGRVGRLVMFKMCLEEGIMPFVIEEINRAYYINGIINYNVDRTQLTETILHEQEVFKARYEKFSFPKK